MAGKPGANRGQEHRDAARVEELERHVAQLAAKLDDLFVTAPQAHRLPGAGLAGPTASLPAGFPGGRAAQAREHIRQRRLREQFFPADMFADPVWDMMLDLYAAHYEGEEIPVSSLCIAAAVPATTALRWIKEMTAKGWLIRSRDPNDGRRVFLRLSDGARAGLDSYFDSIGD
ncbi:MAG TPA: winged helix DNA-binding protein [Sphingopyxis sp.]|nr:winged helix DNA-binding protein [Sphingopyxis sp.]HMP43863.1 winged helix DNA-binding protein [Sphingopyxis sp.]HMQ20067.1 winged helix DNA-binding protein [Sphingopyxis sp.]